PRAPPPSPPRRPSGLPGAALRTNANGGALIQAFMALLLNASDAMQNAGRITLSTRARPGAGELMIEFVDEGTGISRADLPRLFEDWKSTRLNSSHVKL